MALQFQTPITLENGITLASAYGRVTAQDEYMGTMLQAYVELFVSEEAFTAGAKGIQTGVFNPYASVAYDRSTMGVDILDLAHDALVASLAAQNITATKNL